MTSNKNNKVGKFTGNYTQTGRKIYKKETRTGTRHGKKYSEDELIKMLKNKKIKPTSIHKSQVEARKAAIKRSSLLKPKDN